jgi:hypothetical protein
MFTEKDILARLQKGEDAQKIADEMVAILNAANKTYTDQKEAEKAKAEAAKKAAAEKAQKVKKGEADKIAGLINQWIEKHYGVKGNVVTGEMLIEIMDSTTKAMKAFENIESLFDVKPVGKKSTDAVIADFLKEMGW